MSLNLEELDALVEPLAAQHEARQFEIAEGLRDASIDLAALDALLTPLETHAKAIEDGLERRAQQQERAAKVQDARWERQWFTTEDGAEMPWDWETIRQYPEVAPLIAEGWEIEGIEPGDDGKRWARLRRRKAAWGDEAQEA